MKQALPFETFIVIGQADIYENGPRKPVVELFAQNTKVCKNLKIS